MKLEGVALLLSLLIGAVSCGEPGTSVETHSSPSGTHLLEISIGNWANAEEQSILMLRLITPQGKELHYLNTGASNAMKWAGAWVNDSLFILDSRDIGPFAWKISRDGHFLETKVSEKMLVYSQEAFALKYHKKKSR